MQLEFHQLDRGGSTCGCGVRTGSGGCWHRWWPPGSRCPSWWWRFAGAHGRYLVIDGYQRVAALEQLGRDTVEAVVWPLSEAEALLLDGSLRMGERETALEQGWLLAELEQRFGYGLEHLARRFDRSVSWVSRRLALVELLPETVQQRVRAGAIAAHVAMKYLVPMARANAEEGRRMAALTGLAPRATASRLNSCPYTSAMLKSEESNAAAMLAGKPLANRAG